jgi:curved DNA-binding protein CbpA
MNTQPYYDILGVASTATIEEITIAKNNLAKIYHPDANIHCDVDTTIQMQEILEAYEFLCDRITRGEASQNSERIFKAFQMDVEVEQDEDSFVLLWQAAQNLHLYVSESLRIHEENQHLIKSGIPVFRKMSKNTSHLPKEVCQKLQHLKAEIITSTELLSKGNLPAPFWNLDAMNWVLIRWGQKQSTNYLTLFHRYEHYVETNFTRKLRSKRKSEHRQFCNQLTKVLSYSYC